MRFSNSSILRVSARKAVTFMRLQEVQEKGVLSVYLWALLMSHCTTQDPSVRRRCRWYCWCSICVIACHPPSFPPGQCLPNIFFVFPHPGHSCFRRFCHASPSFTVKTTDVQRMIHSLGTPLTWSNLLLMLMYGKPNSVLSATLGSANICRMLILLCLLFCMFLLVLFVCVS
jgi:hypothetical protein